MEAIMTSLVTGGTGFIGAEVGRLLLESGDERPVVFSRHPASTQRLADVRDRVEFVAGDLGNFSHVLQTVKQVHPAVIYHFGGVITFPAEADPTAALHTNDLSTFHVLEAARLFEIPQVLFASTILVYWLGSQANVFTDAALERPVTFYGITKLFGEHLGLFYKRKYGLDFRSVRYPNIVGPGRAPGGSGVYWSWVVEACAKEQPFTMPVRPDSRMPLMYFKDAARALVYLGAAPVDAIKTVNYVLDGVTPTPEAGEVAAMVRAHIPGAQIAFQPDPQIQRVVDNVVRPIDDRHARQEWHWAPAYDLERMVGDFLQELRRNP
jgi:threonine 3-dehydrogenase